jgi:hypothetical protein
VKPRKKMQKRLDARVRDYELMMATKNTQSTHSRKETGGFRRPGSRQWP